MSHGFYIHWPFCRRKCPYCSFASSTEAEGKIGRYAEALRRELKTRRSGVFEGEPSTVYIGGGTPSLVPAGVIRTVLDEISLAPGAECTVEANPDSLDERWLDSLLETGVNRISIGVQALDDRLLANLGRLHRSERAEWAVRAAQRCGFDNISIDLMFGIPGQTAGEWSRTLERALELGPDHISAYSLGVEEDTPYFETASRGGLNVPDTEETAGMYLSLVETLRKHGFERYEISNFSRPGHECRHNEGYWNFTPYLGIGVSAHSFDGERRWWNKSELDPYLADMESGGDPVDGREEADPEIRALEELMLSLRRAKGLNLEDYARRYPGIGAGMTVRALALAREGLLEVKPGELLALTDRGALVADEILAELAQEFDNNYHKTERNGRENV